MNLVHRIARAFVALPLLTCLLAITPAQAALPSGVTQGATVEGITEYRLANGLTVLLYPDASQPKTTVNVTYRVGSAVHSTGSVRLGLGMRPKASATQRMTLASSKAPATISTALSGW